MTIQDNTQAPSAPLAVPSNSAPPPQLNLDFTGARNAGYSDEEIIQHLASSPSSVQSGVNGALSAGYSPAEIITHLGGTPTESGVIDSLREGSADVLGGVGATLHDYLGQGLVGDALTRYAKAVAPKDFTPARIVGEDGSIHPGNIPAWLAERAPGMVAQIAAARLMPGGVVPKTIAAAGTGTLMSAGNEAQTAMDNSTGTTGQAPDAAALARGGATAVGEGAIGALPITRFLPGYGALAKTGGAGALQALKKLGITAGAEAASGAGQSVVGQVGQSIGTPGGVKVDPAQVADTAIGTGLTGGALAVPFGGGARDLLNARKYSAITPDLMPAATQFANRMQDAAGGRNMNAGIITGSKAQATGADAFTKAQAGVHSELANAVSQISTPIPADASNILKATATGAMPTDADYATLKTALGNDPQAPNILNLVQQAHAAQIVADTGHLGGGKFTGGLAAAVGSKLTGENLGKTAMVGAGGAMLEGGAGHLIAYSPEIMAATAGATALARLSDNLTGARSPAGRFVSNFADGTTPVRVAPTIPTAPPAPAAPLNAPLGGPGQPWGRTPSGIVPTIPQTPPAVNPQTGRQMVMQAAPALRALAAQAGPNAMARQAVPALRALAAQSGPNAPVGLPDGFAGMLSNPGAQQNLLAPRPSPTVPTADPVAALKELAARSAPPPLPNVTNVAKANGKVNVGNDADEYAIPYSPHADKAPAVAARAFLQDAKDAGVKINNENGFITGVTRNITNIRSKAADVAAHTPGVSSAAIAAQFEGAATAKDASAHREWLMKTMPQAAPLLSRVFSDAEIAKIWKR